MATKQKHSINPQYREQIYFGVNVLDRSAGFMRKPLKDFSAEECEAWLRMNPQTARKFVIGPMPEPLPQDNEPGKSLPKPPPVGKTDKDDKNELK